PSTPPTKSSTTFTILPFSSKLNNISIHYHILTPPPLYSTHIYPLNPSLNSTPFLINLSHFNATNTN
ncbi:hypothetical protein, partial [Cytobacillus oceanisediminis]|uniref:hypothetical protein n=1 Tax=Cytobacillus oceanisediminis TaxID=665099 RepID=UPI0021B6DF83